MGSLTTSQRQQRLTNVLLAGNLYKSHQISKKLTEVSKLQKISIGVSVANLAVNRQISRGIDSLNQKIEHQISQKEREEAEKKKIKLLKDICKLEKHPTCTVHIRTFNLHVIKLRHQFWAGCLIRPRAAA